MSGASDDLVISGFRRADGRLGLRNHLLVLGINGLAASVAQRIARQLCGAICAATLSGRGQVEPDLTSHRIQLAGLGRNPNVGGVLIVGVDEESVADIRARIAPLGKPVDAVSFSETREDMLQVLDLGIRRGARLLRTISAARRAPGSARDLVIGIECGHSDASSGIACNPVVGAAVDRLIDMGATAILGETVEWLGAEHLLARRARTPSVADAILAAVAGREAMARHSGKSLTGNNPGEENIRGGLSTIEEKSLGAVIKSGSRPIESVVGLAEPPAGPGLHLMDGPSFSPESLSGFAAAGAQLMIFTTGPGNSFASAIAPTIKVTAQPDTARRLAEQVDFDASAAFLGQAERVATAERLLRHLGEVADGTLTWGEILGEGLEAQTRLVGSL